MVFLYLYYSLSLNFSDIENKTLVKKYYSGLFHNLNTVVYDIDNVYQNKMIKLKPVDKLVYVYLRSFANKEGETFVSIDTLSSKCELS